MTDAERIARGRDSWARLVVKAALVGTALACGSFAAADGDLLASYFAYFVALAGTIEAIILPRQALEGMER